VVIGIQWLTTKPQGHKEIFASNNPFESCPHNLAKSLFLTPYFECPLTPDLFPAPYNFEISIAVNIKIRRAIFPIDNQIIRAGEIWHDFAISEQNIF
jgi:hypothetical protein